MNYDGLNSWNVTHISALDEGSLVYEESWNPPRDADPRHVVLVETPERVLAHWGTSTVKATLDLLQWPGVYRQRNEVQEQSFKRMKAHGALDVNDGITKIVGPDRHQQSIRSKLPWIRIRHYLRTSKIGEDCYEFFMFDIGIGIVL